MNRMITAAVLLAVTASVAGAAEYSKESFLSIQATSATANLASAFGAFGPTSVVVGPAAAAYPNPEWGFKAEYQRMMGPEYAFNISYGMGFYGEEDKPNSNAAAGTGSFKYTQNSWNVRVGGDRLLEVGEHTYIYFGPGIEYWSGKAKFEDTTPPALSYETENTSRISLGARLGGHMMVGPTWGVSAQVGTKVGYASYEEAGGKTTWWPSSMEGSVGLVFKLGN
jgi:opacity protein-like surface antigen